MKAAVVVPSYNRPESLRTCLAALAQLKGDDFGIVVVDDGGVVDLTPVTAPFGALVRLVRQKNGGPASARNRGAREAEAEFIAFTDDDCEPDPGWLDGLLRRHATDPEALIGGRVENRLTSDIYAAASQSLCDFLYRYYRAADGLSPFFTSNNIGCARSVFLSLDGFDESFPLPAAEDRDLGLRWRASGRRLIYAEDALVGHRHHMTMSGFWRQHRNYGRGAHHLHKVMRRRGDKVPSIEGLGFYLGLLTYPFRVGERRALSQCALLTLSQVAMVSGYIQQKRQAK